MCLSISSFILSLSSAILLIFSLLISSLSFLAFTTTISYVNISSSSSFLSYSLPSKAIFYHISLCLKYHHSRFFFCLIRFLSLISIFSYCHSYIFNTCVLFTFVDLFLKSHLELCWVLINELENPNYSCSKTFLLSANT